MTTTETTEAPVVAGPEQDGEVPVEFPVLVIEHLDTSDGRFLEAGSLTHRALPLSLLAQPESSHGGDDPGPSVVVGRIDTLVRTPGPEVISNRTGEPFPEGSFIWSGTGALDTSVEINGRNVYDMVRRRYLRGISVDLAGMDYELVGEDGLALDPANPRRQLITHAAEIAAATLVPIPAFADAYVQLPGETPTAEPVEALAASATPAWRSVEVGDDVHLPASIVAAGEPVSYVEQVRDRIGAELGDEEISGWGENTERLLDLYTLLAMTTGGDTTSEHIHDAWSVATARTDPSHKSLIPFDQLDPDVQAMDDLYRDAVIAAASAPAEPAAEPEPEETAMAALAPGEEGSIGPGEAEYGKPHVYARDPQSGAGNCVCGAPADDDLHIESPLAPAMADADAAPVEDALPDGEDKADQGWPDEPQDCEYGDHPAVQSLLFADGERYVATCLEHDVDARAQIEAEGFEVDQVVEIKAGEDDAVPAEVPV